MRRLASEFCDSWGSDILSACPGSFRRSGTVYAETERFDRPYDRDRVMYNGDWPPLVVPTLKLYVNYDRTRNLYCPLRVVPDREWAAAAQGDEALRQYLQEEKARRTNFQVSIRYYDYPGFWERFVELAGSMPDLLLDRAQQVSYCPPAPKSTLPGRRVVTIPLHPKTSPERAASLAGAVRLLDPFWDLAVKLEGGEEEASA